MPLYTYEFTDVDDGERAVSMTHGLTELDGRPVKRIYEAPSFGWGGKSPALEKFWDSGDPADIPRKGK